MVMTISPPDAAECYHLADALGDSVETALSFHLLGQRVYVFVENNI